MKLKYRCLDFFLTLPNGPQVEVFVHFRAYIGSDMHDYKRTYLEDVKFNIFLETDIEKPSYNDENIPEFWRPEIEQAILNKLVL